MNHSVQPKTKLIEVKCTCGHSFEIESVLADSELGIEICSKCHPFYTGNQKVVDTAGRIDKFNKRFTRTR